MLPGAEAVGVWAVRCVDGLLQAVGKILVELRLLRPPLRQDKARDVIGVLVAEDGCIVGGADRHVVHGIGRERQKPAHSRAAVEGIGAGEWWKVVASASLRFLSEAVRAMAAG